MLRVGTTEGRFRMVMPDLMADFEAACSGMDGTDVCANEAERRICGFMGDAVRLREMLLSGELDLAFSGLTPQMSPDIESRLLLDEQLYFVISDRMLQRYQPEYMPVLRASGNMADMQDFRSVPVCRSLPHLHCMKILDEALEKEQVSLNCVHVSGHYDLHLELAVRDYAACFCLGMYLPYLNKMNKRTENKLHVFRIKGLTGTNPVYLLQMKEHKLTPEWNAFIGLLEKKCREIAMIQNEI